MGLLAPLAPYREVLELPRVRSLIVVTSLARVPAAGTAIVLTLHVVLTLHGGYAAAGALVAALTVGGAVGAPLTGRITDRRGLRTTLALTATGQGAFWLLAPALPLPALIPAACLAGLLQLPLFTVSRQTLAALVPEGRRLTAYSLDSMAVEVSYMLGPAGGALVATQLSTRAALVAIGCSMIAAGLLLYLLNPPVRSEAEERAAGAEGRIPRRAWIGGPLLVVLVAAVGATVALAGADVSIVATLRHAGELRWSGLVIAAWCLWSLIGGFVYGALARPVPSALLVLLLGVLTIPVGLAGHWWTLIAAMVPAGALCAPSLAATGEAIARLVPARVRGEALGLQSAALAGGVSLGAPLAGGVADRLSPGMAFVAVGAASAALALVALLAPALPRPGARREAGGVATRP